MKRKNIFGEIRIEAGCNGPDRIKLNGRMDTELKKIIKKYNIPKEWLYCGVPVIFGWYGVAVVLAGVRLSYGI